MHLGRRAIDFVGQDQVMEQRSLAKFEGALLRAIDIGSGEVGRQQVGRELQSMEIALDTLGKHLDRTCLRKPGSTLDQQVAIAKQRNQHAIDQVRLTDDQAARVRLELLKLFCDAH